jgi:hypothetical protein
MAPHRFLLVDGVHGWTSRRVGIAAASVASRSGFQGPGVMTYV